MRNLRIADGIAKYLEMSGIDVVFGMSAGTVSAIYDALNDTSIKVITTKNEAGGAYSAARYASISRKLGCCIFAGGVGINNGINGVADAMRCKAPMLVISGYVHRWQIGKGAVQELDTQHILRPITKYSKTILDEKDVLIELKKAIEIALTPPYGPAHICIPIDIQISRFEGQMPKPIIKSPIEYDLNTINEAARVIDREEKGIIMVGKGARGLRNEIMELSKKLIWPIITTPQGKGVVSTDFELNLGSYGFCSVDAALEYVEKDQATCLLVLGSSLGESATRNFNDVLVKDRKVIHIDFDEDELNKVFKADVAVHCDLKLALPQLIKRVNKKENLFKRPKELNKLYERNHTGLSTRQFLEKVVDVVPKNTYFLSDIGEFMNFNFKYLPIREGMDFDISLNYGAMGSGIGGAMGAYLATLDKKIAVLVGDGSFFMNGTEILTAKENNMPIMYFVINNSMLGYVEHGHEFLYGRTVEGFIQERISIARMAKAMGIRAMEISNIGEMNKVKDFVADIKGPCVIELITDGSEKVPAADRFKALSNK